MQEVIALLAAVADDLATAMARIRRLAYAILDGTLIPIHRCAARVGRCAARGHGGSKRAGLRPIRRECTPGATRIVKSSVR